MFALAGMTSGPQDGRLHIYDRESYTCYNSCCFTAASPMYITVGKRALTSSWDAEVDKYVSNTYNNMGMGAMKGFTHMMHGAPTESSADKVPVEVAHLITLDVWQGLFHALEEKYAPRQASWALFSFYLSCLWCHQPGCFCCCLSNGCLFCFERELQNLTQEVVESKRAEFNRHGVVLEVSELNRFRSKRGGAYKGAPSKDPYQPTLFVILRPSCDSEPKSVESNVMAPNAGLFGMLGLAPTPSEVQPQAHGDTQERLQKLDKLKESGVISDEEYRDKRGKILDSI